jgi:putative acetyltransferase
VTIVIRPTVRPDDEALILALVEQTFSNDARDAGEELDIVRNTWAACDAGRLLELVGDEGGVLVAHGLAALGRLDGEVSVVAGVAPVCVAPAHQRRGVGSALMHALVVAAEDRGWKLLVLLGDPAFYRRFGFEPASRCGVFYPPVGADNPTFQARPLGEAAGTARGEFSYCWEKPAQ